MDTINKIFWDTDRISMITNHINAEIHSHYMLQIFIGIEDMVDIKINNKSINCKFIVIDRNVPHAFSTVSAKYCYAIHELRLHQNDRCKRFSLV